MSDGNILIIDDDEVLLATTEAVLGELGYKVSTHRGPFGASAAIQKSRPDLVLLDVNMPGLPGPELAELIRNNSWSERTRILFYSSSEPAVLQAAVDATGANGYVRKGDRVELRRKVEQALAG